MRIKLTLKQSKPRQLIPENYQYSISSFIYRTIERSNSEYSAWLHEKGFADGNKKFKFFNFSDFFIQEKRKEAGKIEIISETFTLHISMLSERVIEHFIVGMFESGVMRIFDSVTQAEFAVKFVEMIPEPEFKEVMNYKVFTPAVFSKKVNVNGKDKIYFLDPSEDDYNLYFVKNLIAKYKVCSGNELTDIQDKFEIRLTSDFKKIIRTVKANGKFETKIRGYKYNFDMKAPPEIHRMAWMGGIGIKNSLGFGFVNAG